MYIHIFGENNNYNTEILKVVTNIKRVRKKSGRIKKIWNSETFQYVFTALRKVLNFDMFCNRVATWTKKGEEWKIFKYYYLYVWRIRKSKILDSNLLYIKKF